MNSMLAHANPEQVEGLMRFFKCGPGQYGEGDRFLGIKVPVTRAVVKECWRGCSWEELEECLDSEWHEVRLAGLLALVQRFHHTKHEPGNQADCVKFYLSHLGAVNNWDLVDLSCYEILGTWLLDPVTGQTKKEVTLLYDLARNGKTLWEQRIAIVSTMQFLRHGCNDDTYAIADILINHPHDLIHKAVGWLLREAGKRDEARLRAWLASRCKTMPRTMLRYAIEKFPPEDRRAYLKSINNIIQQP